ncbi:uncharacterized protein LOC111048593 isoform X2 [Nilaparvata lugens]|uniref:uncharacterized protein LOC111048593 isoform X2 n=1 Tax=Nilaparvata lugens TaxID=108931 RepID=UPI00193DDB00|nr:uncharacterized protein LOC111048593 isoform X2 [Nilaparvata lugens]
MCRFDTSICGCSLQTGSSIVCVYHALLSLNLVVGSAVLLQNGSVSDYRLKNESESALRIVLGLGLFTFFLLLILLVGLIKCWIYIAGWSFIIIGWS